ncbi:response regulator [Shimia sp. R10_1]|uniref:response regulator n=1 Tax=Shimia sp. R10_1 TaxID=2821095 RepID=UPI001ADC7022|nr:response regulator [Shimia sp. R10_1]MBO9474727.1 response regulator [Shimia sp. R10_1]
MIENLMMIDDSAIEQKIYQKIVTRSEIVSNLHQFFEPERALEFMRTNRDFRADAILLDINMPRMNGFEFLEAATSEFGADFTNATVIMLTTSISERDMEKARSFEVVRAYINKPLKLDHLAMIDDLLTQDTD